MSPSDLTALREAWEHEFCENGLRQRGNCGCSRCLDDLLRRGVEHAIEHAIELARAEIAIQRKAGVQVAERSAVFILYGLDALKGEQ